jgi:NCS2 family nucleobase:cation symporter-2
MSNLNRESMLYQLDGRAPLKEALPVGLQHVLAMFIGNLAPILVLAGVANIHTGEFIITQEQRMIMLQCCMFASGLATLVQLYPIKIPIGGGIQLGSGLPIVMGTSFAFVPTLRTIGMEYGINVILGSVIVACFLEFFMGLFVNQLKKLFSPIVIGSVLMSIGLYLLPVGVTYFAGGAGAQANFAAAQSGAPHNAALAAQFGSWQNILMGGTVFVLIVVIQRFCKGILKVSAMLIAILVGYIMAIALGQINFAAVTNAGIVSVPIPFSIRPEFQLQPIIAMAIMVLVSGIETMGHVNGMTVAVWDRQAKTKETQGALLADFAGNLIAGSFNTLPNTSFGQNIAIVSMTKIVNKFAILTGALVLILAGLSPKIGAILSVMPSSVLGGAVMTVFAMIMLNGVKMIAKAGFSERNVLILALTFGVGYAIGNNSLLVGRLPLALNFIFSNPTVAVCVISILLNKLFPLSAEDKARIEEAVGKSED